MTILANLFWASFFSLASPICLFDMIRLKRAVCAINVDIDRTHRHILLNVITILNWLCLFAFVIVLLSFVDDFANELEKRHSHDSLITKWGKVFCVCFSLGSPAFCLDNGRMLIVRIENIFFLSFRMTVVCLFSVASRIHGFFRSPSIPIY